MKQFKADWQITYGEDVRYGQTEVKNVKKTIDHLITQHNAFVEHMSDSFERLYALLRKQTEINADIIKNLEEQQPGGAGGRGLLKSWGCMNCGQRVPMGEGHDCPTFKAKLPPNSGGGSGRASGPFGTGGYDPRYEEAKPTFSEAYKNKTEKQMLDVARMAVDEQQASVSTPLFKPDEVRVIQWTDMGMACGGWKIEINKDYLTEAQAEQAREALLK